MAQYATLKAAIDAVIKANGQKEITGTVLNEVLTSMVNSLGANYQFAGVATSSTNPGTPDQNVFYLAFEAGTYTNFNATVLSAGISILMWNGSWSSQTFYTIDATPTPSSNNLISSGAVFDAIKTDGSAYDVSAHFPTGGPDSDGKFTLEYILSNVNTLIPAAWRKGGMSIRFVSRTDNKYVQCRLLKDEFSTDISDWYIEYVEVSENGALSIGNNPKGVIATKEESAFYFFALTDSTDRVVVGINNKGQLVCDDEFLKLALGGTLSEIDSKLSLKVNISDIVDNLTTESAVLPLSAKMGKTLKALIDAVNNSLAQTQSAYKIVTSNQYIIAITDNTDKVLCGIDKDCNVYIVKDGLLVSLPQSLKDADNKLNSCIEIADGNLCAFGTEKSELEASPLANDRANAFLKTKRVGKQNNFKSVGTKILACNHDDLTFSDYAGTRKIYNKYGFKGSFCAITEPFKSYEDAIEHIVNIRQMVDEGHEIGLHAMMRVSYWRTNKLYDIRPNGGSSFAPTRGELRGSNSDGTGVNTFGQTITGTTKVSDIFYQVVNHANVLIASDAFTQEVIDDCTREYVLYADTVKIGGIDDTIIDNIMQPFTAPTLIKKRIWWLERWYNVWIDNTLGYSSESDNLATMFTEDYSVPTGADVADYYPDAAHLLNGKMVYWNDTTNPHYSEALLSTDANFSDNSFQLVGKFKKGLFKGCFSCCNYEVMDRCIQAVEYFYRKYFNMNHFTDAHRHGAKDLVQLRWVDNGIYYLNREKTLIDTSCVKLFMSRLGTFVKEYKILKEFGIRTLKEDQQRENMMLEGQLGMYYGQNKIRNDRSNIARPKLYGYVNFMVAAGTTSDGMEDLPYSTLETFMKGVNNWLKFLYENAGQTITRNGVTLKIYSYVRNYINTILQAEGTGKIPVFTVDTIRNSSSTMLAWDLISRFCKDNGYEMMSYESALEKTLSTPRNTVGNLFPNYNFEQTVLRYFGGSSTSIYAYIPDGWTTLDDTREFHFNVENRVCQITLGDGQHSGPARTRIYGLSEGTYRMSYTINSTDTSEHPSSIVIKKIDNKDKLGQGTVIKQTLCSGGTDISESVDITISAPYRNIVDDSTPANNICDGYEDNTCCIEFRANVNTNITLKNLSLIKL